MPQRTGLVWTTWPGKGHKVLLGRKVLSDRKERQGQLHPAGSAGVAIRSLKCGLTVEQWFVDTTHASHCA